MIQTDSLLLAHQIQRYVVIDSGLHGIYETRSAGLQVAPAGKRAGQCPLWCAHLLGQSSKASYSADQMSLTLVSCRYTRQMKLPKFHVLTVSLSYSQGYKSYHTQYRSTTSRKHRMLKRQKLLLGWERSSLRTNSSEAVSYSSRISQRLVCGFAD